MSDLPAGWEQKKIGDVFEFTYGKSLPDRVRSGKGFPVYGSNGIVGYHEKPLTQGETIIIGRKGSVGEVHYSSTPCFPIDTTYYIEQFHDMPARFWYYLLKFSNLDSLNKSTAIPGLNRNDAYDIDIPFPPLDEQKRIVEKLDSLLTRVDSCQTHLERVPQILKRFRQSVLAAATSGRLTEEWRGTHGENVRPWIETIPKDGAPLPKEYERLGKIAFNLTIIEHSAKDLPETWSLLTIADLYNNKTLIDFADGNHGAMYPRKEDFGAKGALFLTATQIGENWEVDIDACPRLRSDKAEKLVKGWARKNDVLLTHNATVGRVALLEFGEEDVLLGTSVTFYRFNEKYILPNYGRILFTSPFFQDQLKMEMAQTTRNQVPITKQVSFNFICPPIEEQAEIVRRVEKLFAYAERLEARYTSASEHVERLTPSLLAKAFRGELVEQDPNDESAEKLLERIKEAIAKAPKESKKSQRRTTMKSTKSKQDGKRISIVQALQEAGKALSSDQLFATAGFPSDAEPDLVEEFFVEIRDALKNKQITRERKGDLDWFSLAK